MYVSSISCQYKIMINVDFDNTTIPKDFIKKINEDYQHFIKQKNCD